MPGHGHGGMRTEDDTGSEEGVFPEIDVWEYGNGSGLVRI